MTNNGSGSALELSPNHIVFVGGKHAKPKMAKDVVIGETVQLFGKNSNKQQLFVEIISIDIIKKEGQYMPLTEDGTILRG